MLGVDGGNITKPQVRISRTFAERARKAYPFRKANPAATTVAARTHEH
jgi:hypothetical protein